MNLNIIITAVVVLLILVLIFAVIISKTKHSRIAHPDKYRSAWLTIEQQIDKGNQPSYHFAVMNADKLQIKQ
mgnify:FL=1